MNASGMYCGSESWHGSFPILPPVMHSTLCSYNWLVRLLDGEITLVWCQRLGDDCWASLHLHGRPVSLSCSQAYVSDG